MKYKPEPFTPEWIEMRVKEMQAEHLSRKLPEDRKTILTQLGYGSYESYLASPLWQKIRRRILKRDRHTCVRCEGRAKEVHHLAYTEAVLKGEDDSLLVSLCAACHDRVESEWTDADKRRVLVDREGARQEKIAAEQARLRYQAAVGQARAAAGGRCVWCKGDTEDWRWPNDGRIYSIASTSGERVDVWLCSGCRHTLEHDRAGHPRTDEEKLRLLRTKPKVRYTRPEARLGFTFTVSVRATPPVPAV